jgi:hypothetical protein
MAALQGGKFWSGFAAGSLSSIMSSAWTGGESFKVNEGVKTGSISAKKSFFGCCFKIKIEFNYKLMNK